MSDKVKKYMWLKPEHLVPTFLLTYKRDSMTFGELMQWGKYHKESLLKNYNYRAVYLDVTNHDVEDFIEDNEEYFFNSGKVGLIRGYDEMVLRKKIGFVPTDILMSVVNAPETIEGLVEVTSKPICEEESTL